MKFPVLLIFISLSSATKVSPRIKDVLKETQKSFSGTYQTNLNSSECGGEIRTENFGLLIQVSYKPSEVVQPNEFCTWIVQLRNVSTYQVLLGSAGLPLEENLLTVTSFTKRAVNVTSIVPSTNEDVLTQADLLIVTFQTGQNISGLTGFTIYIFPEKNSGSNVATGSVHQQLSHESFVSHPSTATQYLNHEMSTFIMPPRADSPFQKIYFILRGLEGTVDYVNVYQFVSSSGTWLNQTRITSSNNHLIINGMQGLLLVFDSDSSSVSSGFHLGSFYSGC